jgi:hypothetical protein
MEPLFESVDDPDLPCAYCVGWANDPDDEFHERSYPVDPRGRRHPAIYSGIHDECAADVAEYAAEHRGDEPW